MKYIVLTVGKDLELFENKSSLPKCLLALNKNENIICKNKILVRIKIWEYL
jgi:hypothetical protein